MLRNVARVRRKDRVQSVKVARCGVAGIDVKMRQRSQSWSGHMGRHKGGNFVNILEEMPEEEMPEGFMYRMTRESCVLNSIPYPYYQC